MGIKFLSNGRLSLLIRIIVKKISENFSLDSDHAVVAIFTLQ
jgi:hypothetical protein